MKLPDLNWTLIFIALLPWGSMAVAALFTPRLSRPDLFFAVTVNPSFRQSPAGREILRRYDRCVVIVAVVALLLVGFVQLGTPALVKFGLLGPMFLELAGWFGAFLAARRRAMPYHEEPTAQREAALRPREVSLPGGWPAQAGPFLILAAVFFCLWWRWDSIPARIPIHWGVGGRPDGWASKHPASVFGGAMIGLLTCSFLASLWYAVLRGVRRIHSSGPRAAREARFIRAISFFLLGMEYWLALLFGLLSLAALRPNPEAPLEAFWPMMLGQTLVIGAVFFIAYRAGQGGWRWRRPGESEPLPAEDAPVGDRTPDECWKLGVFYVNQNDPALFVEKRFGIGWTLNLANPRAWLVIGGILLFVSATLAISWWSMA
ncbi:MAG: DUF5808 domain-containing protein [Verrucomicrobiota bacterium]|jgi:uncharacterized membrane protein